jgi:AraC-like DNA-binding protein
LAKIAVDLQRALVLRDAHGGPGAQTVRVLAQGDGWSVLDVICTCGPQDSAYEERRGHVAIALVAAGTFQYRSPAGRELMTPGSLLLGNAGQPFECNHEHEAGDRCIAFRYRPDYFARISVDAGASQNSAFRVVRMPPLRELSPLSAQACAALSQSSDVAWEEVAVRLAGKVVQLEGHMGMRRGNLPTGAVTRVNRVVRMIESQPHAPLTLAGLADAAALSPYHFLRTFEHVTGVTPHQYVLRARLRAAAIRLATESTRVIQIAFDCGFGDVSNFNRAFRSEFGLAPISYRRKLRGGRDAAALLSGDFVQPAPP